MKPSFRIKEMQAVIERYKQRAESAEAELARLKAQEPSEYQYYYHNHGTGTGEWLRVTSNQFFEKMKVKHAGDNDFSFRELFTRAVPAEPRPAVLPPQIDTRQAIDRLEKEESPGTVNVAYKWGYNQAIADASALGCQPQRFVVKLDPAWWVTQGGEEFLAYPKDKVIEAIKATGGEIAE